MLGIDVSKDDLAAALRDPHTRALVWEMRVPNTKDGIKTLLARAPASAPWVLEPTGRYGLLAVRQARATGRDVLLAPTRQAKAFLSSVQSRAKTDTTGTHSDGWGGDFPCSRSRVPCLLTPSRKPS